MDKTIAKVYSEKLIGQYINGFKIVNMLGFGKSAIVFLGENKERIEVAIKVFDNAIPL